MNSKMLVGLFAVIGLGMNLYGVPVIPTQPMVCGDLGGRHVRLPAIGPAVQMFRTTYAESSGNERVAQCRRNSLGEQGFVFNCTSANFNSGVIFNVPGRIVVGDDVQVVIKQVVFYPDTKVTPIKCTVLDSLN